MSHNIRRVAVIGSGTMGAAIAAHVANAGLPVLMLDIPAKEGSDRNAIAKAGLERALNTKPAAFMSKDRVRLITVGNIEDDIAKLASVDWVVEAVVEDLAIKRQVWEKVDAYVSPTAIISSNSSGIPMHLQMEGRSESFRRRFIGAHFFTPPRYMHLLELIPTKETEPKVIAELKYFGDHVLGKGIVIARDVPGFIANRVGVYSLMKAMNIMIEMGLRHDVVDVLTGPLLGRASSATFRTADLSGIDIIYHVTKGLQESTGEDFQVPAIIYKMLDAKLLGEKTKAGFYKATRDEKGKRKILALNFDTLEYEDRGKIKIEALEKVKEQPLAERIRTAFAMQDEHGEFIRRTTFEMIHYAASKVGVVADSYMEIDNGLRWGFGWECGPFETCDMLGLETVIAGIQALGKDIPPILREYADKGQKFYPEDKPMPRPEGVIHIPDIRRDKQRIIKGMDNASLLDIGDGVLLLEKHTKMNVLTQDVTALMELAIELIPKHGYVGLVIGNQGENFCAGANILLMAMAAQAGQFDAIDAEMKRYQATVRALRYAPFPIVAAPFNMTLGGGVEITMLADDRVASAETYMGLVEVGVGLIPAGGGCTELLWRFNQQLHPEADPFESVKRAFQLISLAKVSTSAYEAQELGLLLPTDIITMNRQRVIADAKRRVRELAIDYKPPLPRRIKVLGEAAYANLCMAIWSMREANYISDYDMYLAKQLARVLSGGTQNFITEVSEEYMHDLEREVFVELWKQPKTQERVMAMLTTGKPLRN
ncbi:MAG: 3-hydroxyacyl-CoA dehydrogenase NAD-binding domain-containing protein [Bacteroidota bacterium]|nr:3-hydroxyacyl-CoA dehydrogenase NAD-binding domain-containing protein [Candidatus Kapabacteria bacterium]MDW8220553.1 3-hydroxyacyl-CoA dehydrogenase NAD-binding domain-containing protein [Bacteroidota bacterium]